MTSAKVAVPVLQEVLDAFNAHDLDLIMSFFADDCVMDMPHGPGPGGRLLVGKDEVRDGHPVAARRHPGHPLRRRRHWVCDDRGVSEWTIRGTQRTGERIEVRGCDLFEFVDGKITRKDAFWKIVD